MKKEQEQPDLSGALQQASPSQRLLVVDDSQLQRRILCSTLGRWGYQVTEAASGEEALAICQSELPDMVISDWMMPGMSGIEFCQAFRALSQERYAYFILLTSKSEKAEVAEGLDSGADDFLIKPVNAGELRARITAGERIIMMQRELSEKNRLISETLEELQRVHDLLDKDLIEAKKLQQSLVRERHRVLPEGAISLLLRPAGHVGGDLVGFFPSDDGMLGLYAIDVSGHGISSALMTARLAGNLSQVARDQNLALQDMGNGTYQALPPKEVVERLNDLVLDEMDTEHYFTLLLAVVDLSTGEITLTQAGHPHPIVQRRDGTIEQDGMGGFPVGLMGGVSYGQSTLQLARGDRLLLLSDGVTECPNVHGELLGETGLRSIMQELKDVQGTALFEALIWELAKFAGTDDFPDDVSGILFEYGDPVQAR